MKIHLSTGQAAKLLGVSEPALSETVRRGRVSPAPTIVAGRRLWTANLLVQAAAALGILTDALRAQIEASAPYAGEVEHAS